MRHIVIKTTAVAAAIALAGCSALQIDVDVYKGPLVHDEDTQVQQLGSIALSAKSVLLLRRNSGFDQVFGPVWSTAETLERRTRYLDTHSLPPAELQKRLDVCLPKDGKPTSKSELCREASLINDLLSAFEDRVDSAFVTHLRELEAQQIHLLPVLEGLKKDSENPGDITARQQAANKALGQVWRELLEFNVTVKRRTERNPTPLPGDLQLGRQLASMTAQLTDVGALLCAVRQAPPELARRRDALVELVRSEDWPQASLLFETVLRLSSANDLLALKPLGDARRSPESCQLAQRSQVRGGPREGVHLLVDIVDSNRVTMDSNRGTEALSLLGELDEQLGKLVRLGAGGFDRGRPTRGLDRLADDAANGRFKLRKSGLSESAAHADDVEVKRFHDSIVDLASRMQFLSLNLTLANSPVAREGKADLTSAEAPSFTVAEPANANGERESFKTTLETIANTLLVLAEDQRRQREHRNQLNAGAVAESAAAVAAFGLEPGKRYAQLLRFADDRVKAATAAEAADKGIEEARKKLSDAEVRRDTADKARQALQREQAALMALDQLLTKSKVALEAERKKAPETTGAQALRDLVNAWIKEQVAQATVQQRQSDERVLQLEAAAKGLDLQQTEKSAELPRAEAWKTVVTQLNQALVSMKDIRMKDANAQFEQADRQEKDARAALRRAELAAAGRRGGGPAAAVLKGAKELLEQQREAALNKLNRDDQSLLALTSAMRAAMVESNVAADTIDAAKGLVASWSSAPSLAVQAPPESGINRSASALRTLDAIEAQLSYQRIQALATGGADSETARMASAALEALTQRRERMSYIRPASTYLRSALTTRPPTAGQALEWSNLLMGTVNRLRDENTPGNKAASAARAELDRAFWDNINQVRLSGAGLSNFAIAKDDVGNWYVKAMGTDSSAMISAAKNLALYNLGGRLDTDMLRIDDLRNKTGRSTGEDEELRTLTAGRSSAGAAAYNSTLGVFQANHDKRAKDLLESLVDELDSERFLKNLGERWDNTTAGEANAPRKTLLAALRNSDATVSAHKRAAIAASPPAPAADVVAPTRTESLLAGLRALLALRSDLASEVKKADFLKPETDTLTKAKEAIASAQTALDETQKLLDAAMTALNTAQAGARATPPTVGQEAVVAAAGLVNQRSLDLADKRKALQLPVAARDTAQAQLQLAQGVQARALEDIDLVLRDAVRLYARKQLNAVEELETAARVVTQGLRPERSTGAKTVGGTAP